jgi:hypothetical protein
MKAKVVKFSTGTGSAVAVSGNAIAIAFRIPECGIDLGDVIDIDTNALDQVQVARNLTTGTGFQVVISKHDVHDLRLPVGHGTSRFPSADRLREAQADDDRLG